MHVQQLQSKILQLLMLQMFWFIFHSTFIALSYAPPDDNSSVTQGGNIAELLKQNDVGTAQYTSSTNALLMCQWHVVKNKPSLEQLSLHKLKSSASVLDQGENERSLWFLVFSSLIVFGDCNSC